MIIKGKLEEVSTTGFQHSMSVKTEHGVLHFTYLDPDGDFDIDPHKKFRVGEEVSYSMKLVFAREREVADSSEPVGVSHPDPDRGTTIAIGVVQKKVDAYVYLLDVGGNGALTVDFAKPMELSVGDKIRVRGALEVEDLE
jgi:hypothetical protein